jgi:hypothetical protein
MRNALSPIGRIAALLLVLSRVSGERAPFSPSEQGV